MGIVRRVVRKWEFCVQRLGGQPLSSDVRYQEISLVKKGTEGCGL